MLFKIPNGPRTTIPGRSLHKYSVYELPRLFNVLCACMSIVGTRPPLASELDKDKPNRLHRFDLAPGA